MTVTIEYKCQECDKNVEIDASSSIRDYCPDCWAHGKIAMMVAYLEAHYKAFSEPPTSEIADLTDNFMTALDILKIPIKIHKQLKMEFPE